MVEEETSAGVTNQLHPPSTPLFACKDVSLDLGGREILKDISLQVDRGEVLGVIGPNGAGKTSLFEVLSGRHTAKSGSVIFNGQDVTALPLYQRARIGIGRTYQTPVVPEELTVGESFKAARQAYKPYLTAQEESWARGLVRFWIDPNEPTVLLDTLDRRKLLLCCLMMRRPSLLLMDEPAAGLINSEVDDVKYEGWLDTIKTLFTGSIWFINFVLTLVLLYYLMYYVYQIKIIVFESFQDTFDYLWGKN